MIAGGEAGHTPGQDGSTLGTGGGPCQAGDVTAPRSVLVVDDQAPFRSAARAVLRRLEGFEFAGEASSGPEAIELVERLRPALVLMDINMPEMNGIEATRQIVTAHPDVVVILCSTYDAEDLPPAAAASGAAAYVNKERLASDTIRRLWEDRDSGTFATR
jgi:two-component system, NarL family, invasion response regulator UvrY